MAYADRSGHARTNPKAPQAFAVCDSCGSWWNRVDLRPQLEWEGDSLADTGFRYCWRCLSKPQPQLKTIILPQDPVPITDPRPEAAAPGLGGISGQLPYPPVNTNQNGFTAAVGPQGFSINDPVLTELDPTNPLQSKTAVLASAATGWGLPMPTLTDRSGAIGLSGVGQQIMPANPDRQYLLLFQPVSGLLAAAQNGTPTLGISPSTIGPFPLVPIIQPESLTVIVGTGSALLQNGLQTPPATVWLGSVWVLGLVPGQPFFAWEG